MTSRPTIPFNTLAGLGISIIAAGVFSILMQGRPMRVMVPLVFAVALISLAARFGTSVAIFGSIGAAIIFAHSMFTPIGSIQVESDTARTNLAWMVLISVAGAHLLYPSNPSGSKK